MNILKRLRLAWNIFRADLDLVEEHLEKAKNKYTSPVANTKPKYEIIGEQNENLLMAKRTVCEVMEELGMEVGFNYKNIDSPTFDSQALPRRACGRMHKLPCGIDTSCKITQMNHGRLPVSERKIVQHRKTLKKAAAENVGNKGLVEEFFDMEEDLKEIQFFIEMKEDNELH